jgi:hypothetical protein
LKKKNIKKYCCQQKQHLPVPAKAVTVIVAGRSAPLEKKKTLIVQEHTISIWNNFYS